MRTQPRAENIVYLNEMLRTSFDRASRAERKRVIDELGLTMATAVRVGRRRRTA